MPDHGKHQQCHWANCEGKWANQWFIANMPDWSILLIVKWDPNMKFSIDPGGQPLGGAIDGLGTHYQWNHLAACTINYWINSNMPYQ